MNLQSLNQLLYWIATGLLVPVMVALLVLLARALFVAGAAFGLFMDRAKLQAKLRECLVTMSATDLPAIASATQGADRKRPNLIAFDRLIQAGASAARREKIVADFELAADSELGTVWTLARVGPILGLMGTLIPMGPGLIGLAAGDLKTLADNMQVAFTTTVVGLVIGGIGLVIYQIKKRWYAEELAQIEFVAGLLAEENKS